MWNSTAHVRNSMKCLYWCSGLLRIWTQNDFFWNKSEVDVKKSWSWLAMLYNPLNLFVFCHSIIAQLEDFVGIYSDKIISVCAGRWNLTIGLSVILTSCNTFPSDGTAYLTQLKKREPHSMMLPPWGFKIQTEYLRLMFIIIFHHLLLFACLRCYFELVCDMLRFVAVKWKVP